MKQTPQSRRHSARSGAFFAGLLAALSTLVGCGAQNENWQTRTPVDEESQGSASLEAHPPSPPADVAIGVDPQRYEDTDPSALTEFRSTLEPYGTWEDTETHGTVWVPSPAVVGTDFVPYSTAGRWAYDDGYVWVSDYSWGWAPFHYGRWVRVPGRGWAWIPGRVYSGAWVTWSYGPSYVGWAPLGPSWYWRHGYAYGHHYAYDPYYVYCPHSHVFHHQVHRHVVHGPAAAPIAANTPPYIPASPSVDPVPGRIPASPSVDPVRKAAAPSVGPAPSLLGHNDKAVLQSPKNPGLDRARAFATPDQARLVGARAPATSAPAPSAPIPRYAERTTEPPEPITGGTRAAFASPGGAGGASAAPRAFVPPASSRTFTDVNMGNNVARGADPWRIDDGVRQTRPAPAVDPWRMQQAQPAPAFERPASRSFGSVTVPSSGSFAAPAPRPTFRPTDSAPVYRPQPSPPSPVFRAQPSMPAPTYRPSAPSPVYRPTPSVQSTPSFRPAPSAPAPVFRSSPSPAPVMRSAPAPVMRSAPAPVMRPSAPAPAARPSPSRAIRR